MCRFQAGGISVPRTAANNLHTLAAPFSGRYTGGGRAASMSLGSRPACEAILVEIGETSLKVLGVHVTCLSGCRAKVSCHAVT